MHGLLDSEELVVEPLDLVDVTLDPAHHHVCHRHSTEVQHVTVVNEQPVDDYRQELSEHTLEQFVKLVAVECLVLKSELLLVDSLDFLQEFGLPAVQFHTFDVVE